MLLWERTPISYCLWHLGNLLINYLSLLALSLTILFYFTGVELNDQLLGSQLLACTISYNTLFGEAPSDLMVKPDGPYDFYQHPNVSEARQCQPVLQGFSDAVSHLLQDWPEHPVLQQVGQVVGKGWIPVGPTLHWGCSLTWSPGAFTCTFAHAKT